MNSLDEIGDASCGRDAIVNVRNERDAHPTPAWIGAARIDQPVASGTSEIGAGDDGDVLPREQFASKSGVIATHIRPQIKYQKSFYDSSFGI